MLDLVKPKIVYVHVNLYFTFTEIFQPIFVTKTILLMKKLF